ncbi:DNA-directed DNA polymerase [Tanacetum coccineum]
MQEVILFYSGLEVPTRQILDAKGPIPTKIAADAKVAIQEMSEYSQKWHNGTSRTRSTETSDGLAAIQAQLNNLGREIKKVNEKVYVAQVGCKLCKGPHHTKYCPVKEESKTLEAYYTQYGVPFEQGGQYRTAAPRLYQMNNANVAIRNQGASIKALEIQIGQMSKVLQERGSRSLPSSTETNPRDHVNSISTTVKADTTPIRPLADLGASLSVMPLSTYLNLGLGELAHTKLTVELADRTLKQPKGIAENVLVGIGTDISEITRKPSKTSKHGHENERVNKSQKQS